MELQDKIKFEIYYHESADNEPTFTEFTPPFWAATTDELNGYMPDESLENLLGRINSLISRLLKDKDYLKKHGFTSNPSVEIIIEPRD